MDENNAYSLSFLLRNGQSLSRDFSSACIRHKEKVQDNFNSQCFMNDDLENLPQAICLKLCLAGRPRAAHLLLHEVSNFFCLSIPVAQSARRSSVALYRNNKVSSDKRPSFCLHSRDSNIVFQGAEEDEGQ